MNNGIVAKSGYKGVMVRPNGKYTSRLSMSSYNKGKVKHFDVCLGTYNTPEKAALARIRYIDSLK